MRCKCGHDNPDKNLVCAGCYEVIGAPVQAPAPTAPVAAPAPGKLVLDIDKPHFTIPDRCVCCLGNPVDLMRVQAVKQRYNVRRSLLASVVAGRNAARFDVETTSWHFPYCLTCVDHVKARQRAVALAIGLGLAASALFLWLAWPVRAGWAVALALLVIVPLLAVPLLSGSLVKRGPACTSPGSAVRARTRGEGYRFTFANAGYGELLESSNANPKLPAHLQHRMRRVS